MYRQTWQRDDLIVTTFNGSVLPETLVDAHAHIMSETRQQPFCWLVDARLASLDEFTIEIYLNLFMVEAEKYRHERQMLAKTAWLVSQAQMPIVRLWPAVAKQEDAQRFQSFVSEAEAYNWVAATDL